MKLFCALLLTLHLGASIQAKDFVIEGAFVVSVPEGTAARERLEGFPANVGFPQLSGPQFSLVTYWWNWVPAGTDLDDVPQIWEGRRKNFNAVSNVQRFTTDSGLEGVRFVTKIFREDRPDFDSEMLLLRDQNGNVVMFQCWGDRHAIDNIFKSLRYK